MIKHFSYFVLLTFLIGCYSFTGGTIPDHIKTLYIASVNDNSGYGNPQYREELTELIFQEFRRDNTLSIADRKGDAKLMVTIKTIRDQVESVRPGELEAQRKITITCDVEYYDAVKKKQFWKQTFSKFEVYGTTNIQADREEAAKKVLEQLSEDILFKVVSGW